MAGRYKKARRDPGSFIQVPIPLLACTAYRNLSAASKALLWDIAAQYKGDNNGRLLAGWTYMAAECGWRSPATLQRARDELLAADVMVVETRCGMFPNRSAWYACTWWPLDWTSDMEMTVQAFPRGAYKNKSPSTEMEKLAAP